MISVIIPTYKNKDLLLANLANNFTYLQNNEIIIVNDDPSKSIKEELKKFKNIILIENKENLGFGKSVNIGVKISKEKYIMILNNDVLLNDEAYKNALKHFEKSNSLFAVSFSQTEKNGSTVGKNSIYWKNGFFGHERKEDLKKNINGWAEGGSCIFEKEKFVELGGFDNIYSPFYWEDIDLSYRAWKKGYQIMFDPQVKVIHHHESTIGKYFTKNKIKEIAFRNQLIFIWKNIEDKKLLSDHLKFIIPTVIKGGVSFIKGFIKAISKLPLIYKKRAKVKKNIFSDKEILNKFL